MTVTEKQLLSVVLDPAAEPGEIKNAAIHLRRVTGLSREALVNKYMVKTATSHIDVSGYVDRIIALQSTVQNLSAELGKWQAAYQDVATKNHAWKNAYDSMEAKAKRLQSANTKGAAAIEEALAEYKKESDARIASLEAQLEPPATIRWTRHALGKVPWGWMIICYAVYFVFFRR